MDLHTAELLLIFLRLFQPELLSYLRAYDRIQ
jgi:hypothetical protein